MSDTTARSPMAENLAIASASEALRNAWTDLLRASYHDSRDVPNQYKLVIHGLRDIIDLVDDMRDDRKGQS